MADPTEKPLTIETVCWLPDGDVQLSGSIGTVTTRFTLDPNPGKKSQIWWTGRGAKASRKARTQDEPQLFRKIAGHKARHEA